MGTDALAAYANRMRDQDERDWPDSLMLLGDQVYADDTSKATRRVDREAAQPVRGRPGPRSRTSRSTPGSTTSPGRRRWSAG